MEIIQVCPLCGLPSAEVNIEAVKHNVNESKQASLSSENKWHVCINPRCCCSYFSRYVQFSITDLIVPLFFKDDSGNVPICYCSNLTRGEIKNAVKNGCKNIDDVRNFTGKNITGFCHERNPMGKCCRKVFLKTISDSLNI
ncbi:MAG: (2Fe-2S)-binding protein [Methanococcaceae archaeon]